MTENLIRSELMFPKNKHIKAIDLVQESFSFCHVFISFDFGQTRFGEKELSLAVGKITKSPTPSKMYHDKSKSVHLSLKSTSNLLSKTLNLSWDSLFHLYKHSSIIIDQVCMIHTIVFCSINMLNV